MSDVERIETQAPTQRSSPWKQKVRWIALFVLVGVFGVYTLASVWERYSSNDYCYAGYAAAYGPLFGRWAYDHLTGVLTSLTLYGMIGQYQHGPTGLLTALVLILSLTMTWLILRQVKPFRDRAALVSLLMVIAVLDLAPAVGQDFYWETGMFEYGLTLLLLLVACWWITRPDYPRLRLANLFGAGITAALTAACSTLGALLCPALFAALWIVLPHDERGWRRNLLAALTGAVIGAVILAAAPGNAYRASPFPPRNFPASVVAGIVSAGLPIVDAVEHSPAAVVALIALIVLTGAIVEADKLQIERRSHVALIVLVIMLGSCVLAEFLAFYATSSTDFSIFGRGDLLPLCVVAVGLALLSIVIHSIRGAQRPAWLRSQVVMGGTFTIFVIVSLIRAGTLVSTMAVYAQQWDRRDTAIRNGATAVNALHIFDRGDVETGWVLDCVRQYYGVAVQPITSNQ